MSNTFVGKINLTPRGVVSVRDGLGVKKHQSLASQTCQSFQTSRPPDIAVGCDFPFSSDVPPPEKLRPGYGLLGNKPKMSRKSAVNALERMAAIELEYGKENCLFLTLTLPCDVPYQYEVLARYSSYCVNRINQFLKDNYGKDNFARVCVWEYQKRGAPHLHMAVGTSEGFGMRAGDTCIDEEGYCMDAFRKALSIAWMHTLESVGDMADCNMFESAGYSDKSRLTEYDDLGRRFCNVQVVKKSIAAYLGSYLAGSNHDKNSLRESHPPIATWAQWDRKATELFKKYSLEYSVAIYSSHFREWRDLKAILLGSIDKAEGTEVLSVSNPFWASQVCISKVRGTALVEHIRDFVSLLKSSGIECRYFDAYSVKLSKTHTRDWQLESDMHSLKYDEYLKKEEIKNALIVPICWDIMEMYCLIEEMQDIIEAQEYSHNEQIRLFYEKNTKVLSRQYPSCKLRCQDYRGVYGITC